MSLDPVALVILGWAGANVSAGAGKYLQDRVYERLVTTFGKATRKTKGPIDANDRVKAKVFAEAAFTDDDLTLEYLAGVMAASGPNDDSGAAIVAQIGRLSALQLRFHYVVYRELRRLWPPDAPMNLYAGGEAQLAGIQLTADDLGAVIGEDAVEGIGSVALPLVREGLVAENFQFTDEPGIARVRPTGVGAELFLWGHGVQRPAADLFDPTIELQPLDVPATPGASLLTPPQPR